MSETRPLCVHLLPDTDGAGAENQTRYLLGALARTSPLDLELVHFGVGPAHDEFRKLGVRMRRVPRRARLAFDLPRRIWALRALYRDRPPDIFHSWLLEGNICALAAARAWPATQLVISQRGGLNELDFKIHLGVQRILRGRADYAISNSEDGRKVLTSIGLAAERISVIPNGLPEAAGDTGAPSTVRSQLGLNPDTELLVWAGRAASRDAIAQKDLVTLIEAFRIIAEQRPGAVLLMVGAREEDLRRARLSPPPRVRAIGWQASAMPYLATADVVVISSREEGDSNVAAEAMMAGRPVASTAVGEHVTAVVEAGGRAIPPGDPAALATATLALLAEPPNPALVREVARCRFSCERLGRDTLAVYECLLSARDGST